MSRDDDEVRTFGATEAAGWFPWGGTLLLACEFTKRLGGAVTEEHGQVVLSHPKGEPHRLRAGQGKSRMTQAAQRHVSQWVRRLVRRLKVPEEEARALIYGPIVEGANAEAEREQRERDARRAEHERHEAERRRQKEADRLRNEAKAREAAERALAAPPPVLTPEPAPEPVPAQADAKVETGAMPAAVPERRTEESVGAPKTDSLKQEKRRLLRLLLKEAERLTLTDDEAGGLIGVSSSTFRRWRLDPEQGVGPSLSRLQEWCMVFRGLQPEDRRPRLVARAVEAKPSPPFVPPPPPPAPTRAVEETKMPGGAIVRLGLFSLDMASLADTDLLALSSAVQAEVLRRAKR